MLHLFEVPKAGRLNFGYLIPHLNAAVPAARAEHISRKTTACISAQLPLTFERKHTIFFF